MTRFEKLKLYLVGNEDEDVSWPAYFVLSLMVSCALGLIVQVISLFLNHIESTTMETPAIIMMTVTFTCVITGVVYFFTKMLRKERERKQNND